MFLAQSPVDSVMRVCARARLHISPTLDEMHVLFKQSVTCEMEDSHSSNEEGTTFIEQIIKIGKIIKYV